jgi:hypothetical protein
MTIQDIIKNVTDSGSYFFADDSMKFFQSRILETVYPGRNVYYFITSEKDSWGGPRRYTVRSYDPVDHSIATVGNFGELSKGDAIKLAKSLVISAEVDKK